MALRGAGSTILLQSLQEWACEEKGVTIKRKDVRAAATPALPPPRSV
jgi:hypothetical protein